MMTNPDEDQHSCAVSGTVRFALPNFANNTLREQQPTTYMKRQFVEIFIINHLMKEKK